VNFVTGTQGNFLIEKRGLGLLGVAADWTDNMRFSTLRSDSGLLRLRKTSGKLED